MKQTNAIRAVDAKEIPWYWTGCTWSPRTKDALTYDDQPDAERVAAKLTEKKSLPEGATLAERIKLYILMHTGRRAGKVSGAALDRLRTPRQVLQPEDPKPLPGPVDGGDGNV